MNRTTLIIRAAVVLGCFAASPVGRCLAQAPPALDDIIDGIGRTERLLFENQSLLLRYARTKSEDVTPSSASGGLLPAEWTLAYRGGKWFCERRFTEPQKTRRVTIPVEPKTQVVRDGVSLDWEQPHRIAGIQDVELGGNFYAGLFYTRNLSLNCAEYFAKSQGIDLAAVRKRYADDVDLPFLPDFLSENRSRYQILSAPEEVDGTLCWVVEWPGMDRISVDPTRGFTVPRRVFNWGAGKPARFEFHNTDYREVKPGLWLPFKQVEERYASIISERPAIWGKVASRSEYELLAVEFDKVPDSFFEVKLPPGTRVIDTVRHLKYTVAANDSAPFEAAIAQAKGAWRWWPPIWLWIVSAACVLIVLGWAFRRRLLRLG